MPLPKLSVGDLHPRGDWFMGRRLPEFRINWSDERGQQHPIWVVGRYASCQLHVLPKLPVGEQPLCDDMARKWHETFNTETLGLAFSRNTSLWYAMNMVMATMGDSIRLETGESLQRAEKLIPAWIKAGDQMKEALSSGVFYHTWAKLLMADVPQLARPGLISPIKHTESWELRAFLLYGQHLMNLNEELTPGKLAETFDDAFEEVNGWGFLGERGEKPASVSGSAGFGWMKLMSLHLEEKDVVGSIKTWMVRSAIESITGRDDEEFEEHKDAWLYDRRKNDDIDAKTAERWLEQGLVTREKIMRAQELSGQYPRMRPGRVAWFVSHPELPIQEHGFGKLEPIDPSVLKAHRDQFVGSDNPARLTLLRSIKTRERRVVPADWWMGRDEHLEESGALLELV